MARDQTSSSIRRPRRSFVIAVTVALWSYLFAYVGADSLLRLGWTGGTAAGILGLFLACGLGIAMCLALEPVAGQLIRSRFKLGVGLLALVCSCGAILWTVATRLWLMPTGRMLTEWAGFPVSRGAVVSVPTPWIALIFLAWAGYWLAASFADVISSKEDEVGRAASRIVELEALLGGGADPSASYVSQLWVPSRDGPRRLNIDDLLLVRAERDYVRLIARDGREYLVRSTLHRLGARLDPVSFLQVSRSLIVNIAEAISVRRGGPRSAVVELPGGLEAQVSRRFIKALNSLQRAHGSPQSGLR